MSQGICIIRLSSSLQIGVILVELPRHLMERGAWHVLSYPEVRQGCPLCSEFHDALILTSQLGSACWSMQVLDLPEFCERSRRSESANNSVDFLGGVVCDLAGFAGNEANQGIFPLSRLLGDDQNHYEFSLCGRNRFDRSLAFLRARMQVDSHQEFFDSVDGRVVPIVYDATWQIMKDWLMILKDEIDRSSAHLVFC